MPSLASASVRQRLLSFRMQCFLPSLYKACSGHTKAYKCFAENLQTVHRKRAFSVCLVVDKCTIIFPFYMMTYIHNCIWWRYILSSYCSSVEEAGKLMANSGMRTHGELAANSLPIHGKFRKMVLH